MGQDKLIDYSSISAMLLYPHANVFNIPIFPKVTRANVSERPPPEYELFDWLPLDRIIH